MQRRTSWLVIAFAAAAGAGVLTFAALDRPSPPEVASRPAPPAASPPARVDATVPPVGAEDRQPHATGSIRPPAATKPMASLVPSGPYSFSARREGGALVLRGAVPDAGARHELAALARERFFQERIVDETRLVDGAPPRFLSGARLALDQLSLLAAGEASITGTALRLEGEALYGEAASAIPDKVRRDLPAGWTGAAAVRLRSPAEGEGQ